MAVIGIDVKFLCLKCDMEFISGQSTFECPFCGATRLYKKKEFQSKTYLTKKEFKHCRYRCLSCRKHFIGEFEQENCTFCGSTKFKVIGPCT